MATLVVKSNDEDWAMVQVNVLTPKKVGDIYIYDQGNPDYDVPPSRYFPQSPARPTVLEPPSDIYDSPRSHTINNFRPKHGGHSPGDVYDILPGQSNSNRSSTVSMLSTGSAASNLSGTTPCSSSRSSAELRAQDVYDVPPSAKPIANTPSAHIKKPATKSKSLDMELDTYNIPRNQYPGGTDYIKPGMEIYDTPPSLSKPVLCDETNTDYAEIPEDSTSRTSADSGIDGGRLPIPEDIYDTPPSAKSTLKVKDNNDKNRDILNSDNNQAPALAPKKGSRSSLHGLLGLSHNSSVKDDVYDVPPTVSRDPSASSLPSLLRNKSGHLAGRGSLESNQSIDTRSSVCSENSSSGSSDMPSIAYTELQVNETEALELLNAAQDDLNKSVKRLITYVQPQWRTRENLEANLFDIKVSCISVKTALKEFVEFSEGTVANSVKAQDKKLVKNLVKQLEPLQGYQRKINESMKVLDEQKWLISKLLLQPGVNQNPDHLRIVTDIARILPDHSRSLYTIIHANASLLFESDGTKSMKPARPPPPLKAKPTVSMRSSSVDSESRNRNVSQRRSIQERPLPVPPRPLPKTPDELAQNEPGSKSLMTSPLKTSRQSSVSTGTRSRSSSPQAPPITFRARSNSDYDNNWGNATDISQPRDSTNSIGAESEKSRDSVSHTDSLSDTASQTSGLEDQIQGYETPTPSNQTGLSSSFRQRLERLQATSPEHNVSCNGQIYDHPPKRNDPVQLDENDRNLLKFYADQTIVQSKLLCEVTDKFFTIMKQNPPPTPQIFIEHSKAVIVAGQKLVFICDTITRNISVMDIREKIMGCAFQLCECLKLTVVATKKAGRQYPNLIAIQDMNDRLVDVSHAANEVKLVITQASAL